MTIRYRCNTGEGKCYAQEHMPDWSILDGCFPRKIRPTDIDGAVEIGGYVLFLEWKGQTAPLTRGQEIMFETMTRDAPKQRVLVVFGDRGKPQRAALFFRGRRRNRECDIDWLRGYCRQWAEYAAGKRKAAA